MAAKKSLHSARQRAADLYGNAPDHCEVALLLIDVINDLEFEGGDKLLRGALPAARALLKLKARARSAGVPCIYINDNFGRWRSDFSAQVRHCLRDEVRGAPLAELLAPDSDDYFVLKAKHSAFYQTSLEILLQHLGAKTLVVGGFSTDNCVSFSANDAFLRGYSLVVLEDGTAAINPKWHSSALAQMERVLKARIARCDQLRFAQRAERHSVSIRSA